MSLSIDQQQQHLLTDHHNNNNTRRPLPVPSTTTTTTHTSNFPSTTTTNNNHKTVTDFYQPQQGEELVGTSTATTLPMINHYQTTNNNNNMYNPYQYTNNKVSLLAATSTQYNYPSTSTTCGNQSNCQSTITNNVNNNITTTTTTTTTNTTTNTNTTTTTCNNNNNNKSVTNQNNPRLKQTVQNHSFDTPIDKYKVTEIIGSGTYGVVAICKDQESDQQFALKKNIRVFPDENDLIQASSNSSDGKYTAFNNSGKLHQLRMLRELKMLHHFRNCPYIVCLKDVYVPNQLNELRDIEMVTSLMEADLRDIFDSGQVLSPKHVKWFMYQICLSIHYMQQARILHRDLKPENILVNSQCDVSICDFGLARGYFNSKHLNNFNQQEFNNSNQQYLPIVMDINMNMNGNCNNNNHMNGNTHMNGGGNNCNNNSNNEEFNDSTRLSSNYVVSRWYRPPELLTNATQVYNKTLDMWSIGCIMYELLSGKGEVLFKGSGSIDQIQRIVKQLGTPAIDDFNGSDAARDYIYNKFPICKRRSFTKRLPPNTCPMAIDLLKRMLTFNMYKRITPMDALLHPYFREFYDPSDLNIPMTPFDTAWEERMLTSADLKLEAFNTLQSIKRDHQRELFEEHLDLSESAQYFQTSANDGLIDDQDDEYQELLIDDQDDENDHQHGQQLDDDDIMMGNGHHHNILPIVHSTMNSPTNQEDFLMMVVDNYKKMSVVESNNGKQCYHQQSAATSQQHVNSKQNIMMDDRDFSPTSVAVEMNISYHTTRV